MSIPKISGQQARELLDGTTAGPWLAMDYEHAWRSIGPIHGDSMSEPGLGDGYLIASDADVHLAAAAPALAETVAWLYGREPYDEDDHVWLTYSWRVDVSPGGRVRLMLRDGEVDDLAAWAHHVEPAEAVDLARALLAAAEEARHE